MVGDHVAEQAADLISAQSLELAGDGQPQVVHGPAVDCSGIVQHGAGCQMNDAHHPPGLLGGQGLVGFNSSLLGGITDGNFGTHNRDSDYRQQSNIGQQEQRSAVLTQ